VLGKQTYSPFLNPEVERVLKERGITQIYIPGFTPIAARATRLGTRSSGASTWCG